VIVQLAVAHTLGNLLTNVSLGRVNVSFTHTIKAMEPFFTVLLSVLLLGEVSKTKIRSVSDLIYNLRLYKRVIFSDIIFEILINVQWPSLWIVCSLLPIVAGVSLASFTEASFNWYEQQEQEQKK